MRRQSAGVENWRPANLGHVHNIEEFKVCQQQSKKPICPYFGSWKLTQDADVILCPYNYILEPIIRSKLDIDNPFKRNIIIFDEAHNMEDICREAATLRVDLETISSARDAFQYTYNALALQKSNQQNQLKQPKIELYLLKDEETGEEIEQRQKPFDWGLIISRTQQILDFLFTLCQNLRNLVDNPGELQPSNDQQFAKMQRQYNMTESVSKLERLGLGKQSISKTHEALKYIKEQLKEMGLSLEMQSNQDQKSVQDFQIEREHQLLTDVISQGALKVTENIVIKLQLMYEHDGPTMRDYHLVVSVQFLNQNDENQKRKRRFGMTQANKNDGDQQREVVGLDLICMNPAVIFRSIAKNAWSIIVMSGTLTPMEGFESELGVNFAYKLSNKHVVDSKNQILAQYMTHGRNNSALLGTYQVSNQFKYQDEIGHQILQLAKVIPDGMLIFFPSYAFILKCIKRWQQVTYQQENDANLANIIYQDRQQGSQRQFKNRKKRDKNGRGNQNPESLYGKLQSEKEVFIESSGNSVENIEITVKKYKKEIDRKKSNGAILMGVCRGKLSEGVDFPDQYARCVVVVAIPYPSVKDFEVSLKRAYNDKRLREVGGAYLSGSRWYELQAFRALNQALGRCIRHILDYGAIILLETRFNEGKNKQMLSQWIKENLRQTNPSMIQQSLANFFQNAQIYVNQKKSEQNQQQQQVQQMQRIKQEQQNKIKNEYIIQEPQNQQVYQEQLIKQEPVNKNIERRSVDSLQQYKFKEDNEENQQYSQANQNKLIHSDENKKNYSSPKHKIASNLNIKDMSNQFWMLNDEKPYIGNNMQQKQNKLNQNGNYNNQQQQTNFNSNDGTPDQSQMLPQYNYINQGARQNLENKYNWRNARVEPVRANNYHTQSETQSPLTLKERLQQKLPHQNLPQQPGNDQFNKLADTTNFQIEHDQLKTNAWESVKQDYYSLLELEGRQQPGNIHKYQPQYQQIQVNQQQNSSSLQNQIMDQSMNDVFHTSSQNTSQAIDGSYRRIPNSLQKLHSNNKVQASNNFNYNKQQQNLGSQYYSNQQQYQSLVKNLEQESYKQIINNDSQHNRNTNNDSAATGPLKLDSNQNNQEIQRKSWPLLKRTDLNQQQFPSQRTNFKQHFKQDLPQTQSQSQSQQQEALNELKQNFLIDNQIRINEQNLSGQKEYLQNNQINLPIDKQKGTQLSNQATCTVYNVQSSPINLKKSFKQDQQDCILLQSSLDSDLNKAYDDYDSVKKQKIQATQSCSLTLNQGQIYHDSNDSVNENRKHAKQIDYDSSKHLQSNVLQSDCQKQKRIPTIKKNNKLDSIYMRQPIEFHKQHIRQDQQQSQIHKQNLQNQPTTRYLRGNEYLSKDTNDQNLCDVKESQELNDELNYFDNLSANDLDQWID